MEVERRKMMAMKNKKIQAEKEVKEKRDNGESRDILTGIAGGSLFPQAKN